MSSMTELESAILNAQGGGQRLSFALEPCSTNRSIFNGKICVVPLYIRIEEERQKQQKQEEQRKREEEERRRIQEEEERRQRELEESRKIRGGAQPIDLGLSVLWADHNLGAFTPKQAGKYSSWNDLEKSMEYWGEGWRIPTLQEMQELMQRCTWSWTNMNGMPGFLVTAFNGNSIFLPAGGACFVGQYDAYGMSGRYWTNHADPQDRNRAMYLEFSMYSGDIFSITKNLMLTIRPVHS